MYVHPPSLVFMIKSTCYNKQNRLNDFLAPDLEWPGSMKEGTVLLVLAK